MAVRKVCDRCGKEIIKHGIRMRGGNGEVDISVSQELVKWGWSEKRYDLCYDCWVELKEWLKGVNNEPKTENEENETGAGVV